MSTRNTSARRRTTDSECDPRFETVINSISDGVFAVDRQWRITCFNAAAERTMGVRREQVFGRRCRDVFRSNICDDACALRYTLETGRPVVDLPVHFRNANGEEVPVTISTALLLDAKGHAVGGVETFRDLNMVKEFLLSVQGEPAHGEIETRDPRLRHILDIVPMIARSESTVLIEGESGTGKGLLAQAIHRSSARARRPMVTVSCGALPESLLESELFGYRAGAFTGATRDRSGRVAAANGGTLFLDEIGELPIQLQVKLLRLLQDRVYEPLGEVESRAANVRILAATNRNLADQVEAGTFRRDLFYRLNVIRLEMPPLRERRGDIPLLADGIVQRLAQSRGKMVSGISPEVMRRLMHYDYPGNVRELENILEHAFVLCQGSVVDEETLPEWFLDIEPSPASVAPRSLEEAEAQHIRAVLMRNGWSRVAAARELGIHRTTLHRKLRRFDIECPPVDGRS